MPYAALPDRRIPYDNDGSVVGQGVNGETNGLTNYPSGAVLQGWQTLGFGSAGGLTGGGANLVTWFFWPERRELTGYACFEVRSGTEGSADTWKGSQDSTNGLDGTWETASLPSGQSNIAIAYDWRGAIRPISFVSGKRVHRLWNANSTSGAQTVQLALLHLYGEKSAGQTPDDIIYIDHDTTPGVEFTAPEDFGDQPLGTTVVRQFRIKNTSALTANTIAISCNDADFSISTDSVVWVTTINLASLAAGAESATYYVRSVTPAIGALLGPRFARIVTTVASYT